MNSSDVDERSFVFDSLNTKFSTNILTFDRDKQLVTACVVVGSALTALGSLLADVARVVVDPRLRAK